jgi:hypothetical protein
MTTGKINQIARRSPKGPESRPPPTDGRTADGAESREDGQSANNTAAVRGPPVNQQTSPSEAKVAPGASESLTRTPKTNRPQHANKQGGSMETPKQVCPLAACLLSTAARRRTVAQAAAQRQPRTARRFAHRLDRRTPRDFSSPTLQKTPKGRGKQFVLEEVE